MTDPLAPCVGGTRRRRQHLALARLAASTGEGARAPVALLAQRVHYAPSHLRALFRAAMGEPLARSRRRQRLDAAAARLACSPVALTLLAQAAGYSSLEAFNHAFKARFGRAPSAFAASPAAAATDARAIGIGLALARHFAVQGSKHDHG